MSWQPTDSHAPAGYHCPFCLIFAGTFNEFVKSGPEEIIYRDDKVAVLPSTRWWAAAPGQALVIPVEHYENIYTVPPDIHHAMADLTQKVAIAMRRTYPDCTGISIRQHNEPDGGQDVRHMHTHVFARTHGDHFYSRQSELVEPTFEQRQPYVNLLKKALN